MYSTHDSLKANNRAKYARIIKWIDNSLETDNYSETELETANETESETEINSIFVSAYTQAQSKHINSEIDSEHFRCSETGRWIVATSENSAFNAEKHQCQSCNYLFGAVLNVKSLWKNHWQKCHVDKIIVDMCSSEYDFSEMLELTMYRKPPAVRNYGRFIVPGPFECCCGKLYGISTLFTSHARQCEDALAFAKLQTICNLGKDSSDSSSNINSNDSNINSSDSCNNDSSSLSSYKSDSCESSVCWSQSLSHKKPESAVQASNSKTLENSKRSTDGMHCQAKRSESETISALGMHLRSGSVVYQS